jgi:hypothetical protein
VSFDSAARWEGGASGLSWTLAAQSLFGSNLFLREREIEFTPQTQWAALRAAHVRSSEKNESLFLVSLFDQVRTFFMENPGI